MSLEPMPVPTPAVLMRYTLTALHRQTLVSTRSPYWLVMTVNTVT